jgi:hypothetical protein
MTGHIVINNNTVADAIFHRLALPYLVCAARICVVIFALSFVVIYAQVDSEQSETKCDLPIVISDTAFCDVFGIGRSVVVQGTIKNGVVAFGGDVVINGKVEGDVAAIGGSIKQNDGSYVGGDIIVIGGAYHRASLAERAPNKTTVMFTGYEQELRDLLQNPTSILSPNWSFLYWGYRLLAILFWFAASWLLAAIMPGVISQASARLQLTSPRVAIIGFCGAIIIAFGIPISLRFLPSPVSAFVGLVVLFLLFSAYLFGRIVIHVFTGRLIQRYLWPEGDRSEALALLLGTIFWGVALSIPYIWPFLVAVLIVTSLGLMFTARYTIKWKIS